MISIICKNCWKEFLTYKAWLRNWRAWIFCSIKCRLLWRKHKKNNLIECLCKNCWSTYRVKKYRKNITKYCSKKCLHIWIWLSHRWYNHHNWKWWVSDRSWQHRKWSNDVKKRDWYRCVECWENNIKLLCSHHVIPYSVNRLLSLDINNWITLCTICHANKHKNIEWLILKKKLLKWLYRNCLVCNNIYYILPSRIKTSKYCSRKCQLYYLHKHIHYAEKMDTTNKHENMMTS